MPSRYMDLLHMTDGPAEVLTRQRDRVAKELDEIAGKLKEARLQVLSLGQREDELQDALKELDAAIRRLSLRPLSAIPRAPTDDAA